MENKREKIFWIIVFVIFIAALSSLYKPNDDYSESCKNLTSEQERMTNSKASEIAENYLLENLEPI
jgi:hypothetical protein